MRTLKRILNAQASQDGAGVKIHRIGGNQAHQILNPYLMIDEIKSDQADDYIAGFPEHPHRGFETITYMKAGRMRHRDHMGNEGVITAGDVQWMTAGSGVLHSEMPEQDRGLLHGFQLWLNLPAAEKMKAAAYQELKSSTITENQLPEGGTVRVIAGAIEVNTKPLQGPIANTSTQAVLLDIQLNSNETVTLSFEADNPALVYVYQGAAENIETRQLGIYTPGDTLILTAGPAGAAMLVLSGQAIHEPLVQHGPFVMNSVEEIEQAILDFQNPSYLKQLNIKNNFEG